MRSQLSLFFVASALLTGIFVKASADEVRIAGNSNVIRADGHAPIGVMGDHVHGKGEWMVSYRYMNMHMEDMLDGSDRISPEEVVTRLPNPNAPPATVRVVPLEMTTQMHMIGAMYAPSDSVTLMAMLNYIFKDMDHLTFSGMMGTNPLGSFKTSSSGFGDTRVGLLWGLLKTESNRLHLNFGLSLPTGSIDETDQVLTPMNTQPTLRLPYAMQLGSGTWDFIPGVTYSGNVGRFGWGAQYLATLRLGENSEEYSLGDIHELTGWGSVLFANWISGSLRLKYRHEGRIDGEDSEIVAPVTTANPDNYGGRRLDLGVGINLAGQPGTLRGHRLALEYEVPVMQDLNGVQLEMRSMATLGYQYAF